MWKEINAKLQHWFDDLPLLEPKPKPTPQPTAPPKPEGCLTAIVNAVFRIR